MSEEIVVTAVEKTVEVVTDGVADVLVKNFSEKVLFSASSIGVLAVAGVTVWGIYSLVKKAKDSMTTATATANEMMKSATVKLTEVEPDLTTGPDLPIDEKPNGKKEIEVDTSTSEKK